MIDNREANMLDFVGDGKSHDQQLQDRHDEDHGDHLPRTDDLAEFFDQESGDHPERDHLILRLNLREATRRTTALMIPSASPDCQSWAMVFPLSMIPLMIWR